MTLDKKLEVLGYKTTWSIRFSLATVIPDHPVLYSQNLQECVSNVALLLLFGRRFCLICDVAKVECCTWALLWHMIRRREPLRSSVALKHCGVGSVILEGCCVVAQICWLFPPILHPNAGNTEDGRPFWVGVCHEVSGWKIPHTLQG